MEHHIHTPTILSKKWRKPKRRLKASTPTSSHSTKKEEIGLYFQNNINNFCSNLLVFGITFEERYVLVARYERRVECCSLEGLTLIACAIFSLQMESFGDEYATTRFNGRRGLYVLPQLLFQNLFTDTFFILF